MPEMDVCMLETIRSKPGLEYIPNLNANVNSNSIKTGPAVFE